MTSGRSRTETGVGRHSASVVHANPEIPMNRSFQPTSPLQRWIFAAAAVLTMLATAGGIEGLIAHTAPTRRSRAPNSADWRSDKANESYKNLPTQLVGSRGRDANTEFVTDLGQFGAFNHDDAG